LVTLGYNASGGIVQKILVPLQSPLSLPESAMLNGNHASHGWG